jgi:hypothetical protein
MRYVALGLGILGVMTAMRVPAFHRLAAPAVVFAAEQGVQPMQPSAKMLFSSDPAHTGLRIGGLQCIPLVRNSDSMRAPIYVVLQQLRSHSTDNGPFSVYLERTGTNRRSPANLLGTFSLYSLQVDTQAQDISFQVKVPLLLQLAAEKAQAGTSGLSSLQVCIVNRSPGLALHPPQSSVQSSSASVDRVLIVELPDKSQ